MQTHEAAALRSSSSCGFLNSCTKFGCSPRTVSNKGSCSPVQNCLHKALSSSAPQYHRQNRRIELKRIPVVLQNGELRFRRNAKDGDDSEAGSWSSADAILGATQTRRDILTKFSSAVVLAVANFLGNGSEETAEASVSRRVKLKDVDNQKLQDALRAAVAGDLENAEILFTEIIKEEPTSASGWSNRGSVRISLGKYELATKDFTKAIELAPEAPVPYLNRAISYEAVGRFDEAIADCKTAIENDPEVCIPVFLPDKSKLYLQSQLFGPSQFLRWHLKSVTASTI
jgi:tetratricopeptide (TPR) repeat protein